MQHSKLLDLLRTFSQRQLAKFREFLVSPYFNRAEELVQFFDYLTPYAPAFEHDHLTKSVLLQRFKTEKNLTGKRLAYLMNQLLGLAEEFLSIELFRSDPVKASFALVSALEPAQLPRHFKPALEKAAQALEEFPYRNADYYSESYRLKALQYWLSNREQHQMNAELQDAADALDEFFIVEKLRYCLVMVDFEYALNLKHNWGLGEWLIPDVDQKLQDLNPTIRIYLTGIRMAQHPEDTDLFFQQKELLRQHSARLNTNEKKLLYTNLLNYCSRRINRFNDQQFFHEYFEINKTLLEQHLLFEESGQLSPWLFINLVNTGLRVGQADWTSLFIETYRNSLPEVYADDVYRMAMGQYYFHQGEYARAQVMLNQTNPANAQLAIMVRNLLARIYYETGEIELLLSFLEAYRVYLIRQELLSPLMKQQARRFVDVTRRLAKIDRPEAHLLSKLKEDLPAATEIFNRDWLLQQIERKMVLFKV